MAESKFITWHLLSGKLYVAGLHDGKNGQITLWHQDQTFKPEAGVVIILCHYQGKPGREPEARQDRASRGPGRAGGAAAGAGLRR